MRIASTVSRSRFQRVSNFVPTASASSRNHSLGGDDGFALVEQTDTGAELDALGYGRRDAQCDERIHPTAIVLGQRSANRYRSLEANRNSRMFRDEERIVAEVFDFARDGCDISSLGGGRDHDSYFHCRIPPRGGASRARTS
jgi:hypothetical protein